MCGIVGITDAGGVSFSLYYALYALQHRGQESAGITTSDGNRVFKFKREGLVAEVFNQDILESLEGRVGVGHVRYPTTGANLPENVQPFNFQYRDHYFALAHNGNLVNAEELRQEFERRGDIFSTTTDTELIASILIEEYRRAENLEDAVVHCMRTLRGSYSVVMLLDGTLYAFRDPAGIKPLCIGKLPRGYIVASESVAIDALNGELLRDVRPGELIRLDNRGLFSMQIAVANHRAHCIFEYIYFARADAILEGKLVYDVRRRIGGALYDEAPVQADMVSPVPDSGISLAIGYAHRSCIPFLEGLMKNRYMGRTFIKTTQEERERAVRIKLNPIHDHIRDRSVVLVDDSIVRGTTMGHIVDLMREGGAAEIHVRIGSPQIIAPCYLGVDMPTREELIGSNKAVEEVRKHIAATSLHHVSLSALVEAIGLDQQDLCMGCLTGRYPLTIGGEACVPRLIDIVGGTYQTELENFGKGKGNQSLAQ
ncbi:MAG: amidophosphoribosyltransferase [Methanomicrobiales archaeon]|nr:amidophosphoribosyltransferase [Methanomicrobiales archaeon]